MKRTIFSVGLAIAAMADSNFTVNIHWETDLDKPYMSGDISLGTPRLNLSAMFLMNFEETVVMS